MIDKVIFLDVDGVLNCQSSKSKCDKTIGIDNSKVKILKEIVDNTNAKIVLTSSWKTFWEKDYNLIIHHHGKYLNNKLRKQGLYILDKTEDKGRNRGKGIYNWIKKYSVKNWLVLDDEIFKDYDEEIIRHWIKTDFYDNNGGLQKNHIEKAIKILNGEL